MGLVSPMEKDCTAISSLPPRVLRLGATLLQEPLPLRLEFAEALLSNARHIEHHSEHGKKPHSSQQKHHHCQNLPG